MDEFKCQISELSRDFKTGKAKITLTADASLLKYLEALQGKDLNCKLKKYTQKRSLSANAYMWVLIDKLADKLNVSKEEVYISYIKHHGRSVDFELTNEAVPTMKGAWGQNGEGWFAEEIDIGEERSIVRFFYGSSCYGVKRMSRLIDAVVQDCKQLDIEILPPDEISRMLAMEGNK